MTELCEALKKADPDTTLLLFKPLSIIGDSRAINAVERLSLNPPTPEIGKAAVELLPILKQRELESRSSRQLLRASESNSEASQELLRGVATGPEKEAALLVRAAGAAPEEQ